MNNLITISYPVKSAEQIITKPEFDLITHSNVDKVTAIKFIRGQYGLGLLEAKLIVDHARILAETNKLLNRF